MRSAVYVMFMLVRFHLSYEHLKECGENRLRGDQIEVLKTLNGHEDIDRHIFFSLRKYSRTRGHQSGYQ